MSAIHDRHPLKAKLAGLGRDESTGKFIRIPAEAEALAEYPELKAEFDRVDELTEEQMLAEYGFSAVTQAGDQVRIKGQAIRDRYRPDGNGNFFHDRVEAVTTPDGEVAQSWVPVVHHVELADPDNTESAHVPNYVWPRERIRLSYGHALKMRAYEAAKVADE